MQVWHKSFLNPTKMINFAAYFSLKNGFELYEEKNSVHLDIKI
jgi:hypothetical protein